MGMVFNTIYNFMRENTSNIYKGTILEIGKQDVYYDLCTIKKMAQYARFSLREIRKDEIELSKKYNDRITDVTLFKLIGFDKVLSLDYSSYEDADIIWDMNRQITNDYYNKFDVIYDGGTCEHVFNTPVFLENLCKMVKVGGTIIHELPTAGYIDHGFYSFSPTLFYDFYTANNFKINFITLFKQNKDKRFNELWQEINYVPGMYDNIQLTEDSDVINVRVSVTKVEEFSEVVYPQQSMWMRLNNKWDERSNDSIFLKNVIELLNSVIEACNYLVHNNINIETCRTICNDILEALDKIKKILITNTENKEALNIVKNDFNTINKIINSYIYIENLDDNRILYELNECIKILNKLKYSLN